jgi:DNA-binding NtrC family response regulator
MATNIAVVSGDPQHWERLSDILLSCGLSPIRCETLAAAAELLAREALELALCEDALPDGDFRGLIAELRRSGRWLPVVVVSRLDDWASYLDAMVAGAFDYVAFPPYPRELERAVDAALAESRSHRGAGDPVAA